MGVKFKNFSLKDSTYAQELQNMYWQHSVMGTELCLQWRLNYDNYIEEDSSTAVGDAIITDSFDTDGDLVISVGYNDGFAIRKVLDDGSFVSLYTDTSVAGGAGCTNFAISKTHHKAFVSYYGRTGTEVYDYSAFVDGGTGPIIEEGIYSTSNSNIPVNQVGNSINNGFAVAGDYLYMMDYASTPTMSRWNYQTDTDASLTVTNKVANGYRGHIFYHERTDRIYANWYYNGELWVVLSASTSGAECFFVDLGPIHVSDDCRNFCSVTTKENDNYVWQINYYTPPALIDITTAINGGSSPIIIKEHPVYGQKYNFTFPLFIQGGDTFNAHNYFDSDLIIVNPYRYRRPTFGWYDQENCILVGIQYSLIRDEDSGAYDYPEQDDNNRQLNYAYGTQAKYVESSGQSIGYYTVSGYAGQLGGYKFRTWAADTSGFTFYNTGLTIFGDFTLDDNSNIESIKVTIPYYMIYILSDTNIECYVSNNGGSDWESYTYSGTSSDHTHIFSTIGNTAQMKLYFSGTPTKSPHITGTDTIKVTIQGVDYGTRWNTRTPSTLKIKGRV